MTEKNIKYYLDLDYPIVVYTDIENGRKIYIAEIPDLPGCSAYAESIDKALDELMNAKKVWIETSLKKNLSIAEPVEEDMYSNRVLLRMHTSLYMYLDWEARKNNLSLNQYITQLCWNEINRQQNKGD